MDVMDLHALVWFFIGAAVTATTILFYLWFF